MERTESWRPLFKGRRDGTLVQFICFSTGGFAIIQDEQVMRLAHGLPMESALDLFLSMIDRPTTSRFPTAPQPAGGAGNRLLCA